MRIINAAEKQILKKEAMRFALALLTTILLILSLCLVSQAVGQESPITINFNAGQEDGRTFGTIDMLFLLMVLTLMPSILIMTTSFTRIIIVLSFLRNAMGTQQSPPNQIIVGMALFLSFFIMSPTLAQINEVAYQPYKAGVIDQAQFVEAAITPMKRFMLHQIQTKDLNLFLKLSNQPQTELDPGEATESLLELGLEVVVPSFITSELKRAFTMGFLIFIPFLIIDLVVSSTLMSMGMVMLPPAMIALPFKLMLFVLVDGWGMLMGTLVQSFR